MLNVVFMGTPVLACASLTALHRQAGFHLQAVVTQPDRPKGRDLKLQPPPVKELALELGLPVLQPERARDEPFIAQLKTYAPDLIAVAAFGQILPAAILDLPRYGCLNVHTSILPRYRGAAPIQWAILNGDPETGVTIMRIDQGLDTGDILSIETTPIRPEDTAETLYDRLAQIGADLLVRTIESYVAGQVQPRPQPAEGVVLAPKIRKEQGRIDWTQPAGKIHNQVRGLRPWPGAFTFVASPTGRHLLKVWQSEVVDCSGLPGTVLVADKHGLLVACGQDSLRITQLQAEGGRRLTAQEFLAGRPLAPGTVLG